MNRKHVIQRLLYLRNWEFLNIFLLPGTCFITLKTLEIRNWQPYAYGLLIVCTILAQGAYYWHLKLRAVRENKAALPLYFHPLFSFFKVLNVALLLVYPALILGGRQVPSFNFQVSVWSNLIFLLAVLEHINYFHYQLCHDNANDVRYLLKHRRIRRSPLYLDMKQSLQSLQK